MKFGSIRQKMGLSSDYKEMAKINFRGTKDNRNIHTTIRRFVSPVAGKQEIFILDNVDNPFGKEISEEEYARFAVMTRGGLDSWPIY